MFASSAKLHTIGPSLLLKSKKFFNAKVKNGQHEPTEEQGEHEGGYCKAMSAATASASQNESMPTALITVTETVFCFFIFLTTTRLH